LETQLRKGKKRTEGPTQGVIVEFSGREWIAFVAETDTASVCVSKRERESQRERGEVVIKLRGTTRRGWMLVAR
jgi:hypothetical protein